MISKVYADKILIERVPPEDNVGGYILPQDSVEDSLIGKVAYIGEKVVDTKVGDYVVFDQYESREITIGSTTFVLTREENLTCKLEVSNG
jgi:co-chaperonin GroES (HSP10)